VVRSVRRKSTDRRISLAQAERAIYVDLEGFQDKASALVGILVGDTLEQVVFDPELRMAAEAKGLRVSSFPTEAARILDQAIREDRVVVGYTRHERDLFAKWGGVDLGEHYRDAHKIAKRWKNRLHHGEPIAGWGLKDFLSFIEYEVPSHLGRANTTKRLRAVLEMLPGRGSYEALSSTKKRQWTNLLTYNQHDCRGMRELVLRAARELEAKG
jgi:hypothetical protein